MEQNKSRVRNNVNDDSYQLQFVHFFHQYSWSVFSKDKHYYLVKFASEHQFLLVEILSTSKNFLVAKKVNFEP